MDRKQFFSAAAVAAIAMLLTGCDVLERSSETPWTGHAFNKKSNRQEFWFKSFSSWRECVEHMEWDATRRPQSEWYSEPIGCAYGSNSLIKVVLFNYWAGMGHYRCIVRQRNPEMGKIRLRYGPVLKGYPASDDVTCVF